MNLTIPKYLYQFYRT